MSFFQAVPGIHKTWVWGWTWWAARKVSKGKGKEPDLELGAVQVGQAAAVRRVEKALTDLTYRVAGLEIEKGVKRVSGVSFGGGSSGQVLRRKSFHGPARGVKPHHL